MYQGRFGSTAVLDQLHLLSVWLYIERNPVEAGLTLRCEEWPWSSAAHGVRRYSDLTLDAGPISRPPNWLAIANRDLDVLAPVEDGAAPV